MKNIGIDIGLYSIKVISGNIKKSYRSTYQMVSNKGMKENPLHVIHKDPRDNEELDIFIGSKINNSEIDLAFLNAFLGDIIIALIKEVKAKVKEEKIHFNIALPIYFTQKNDTSKDIEAILLQKDTYQEHLNNYFKQNGYTNITFTIDAFGKALADKHYKSEPDKDNILIMDLGSTHISFFYYEKGVFSEDKFISLSYGSEVFLSRIQKHVFDDEGHGIELSYEDIIEAIHSKNGDYQGIEEEKDISILAGNFWLDFGARFMQDFRQIISTNKEITFNDFMNELNDAELLVVGNDAEKFKLYPLYLPEYVLPSTPSYWGTAESLRI